MPSCHSTTNNHDGRQIRNLFLNGPNLLGLRLLSSRLHRPVGSEDGLSAVFPTESGFIWEGEVAGGAGVEAFTGSPG